MTATLAASVAILKRKYPKGKLPDETYSSFQNMAMMAKSTDFSGEDEAVSLQTENPQGLGSTIGDAQAALQQGTYNRFILKRVSLYGVARITGEALEAATIRNDGSLVDLWANEMRGLESAFMKMKEICSFGDGSGALGQLNGATTAGATVTLLQPADAVNFDLNMWVQAVSDRTLSPTIRSPKVKIIGIDRKLGVLTISGTWAGAIPALNANDYLIRASFGANAGTALVPWGYQSWIVGGSTPGTFLGVDRNADPVRLAGQSKTYSAGTPIEEAIIDADSEVGLQWMANGKKMLTMNNLDVRNLKKQLGTKVNYDRMKSAVAGISFKTIEVEGDTGPISIVANPFCPRSKGFLTLPDAWENRSLGPAPHVKNFDKEEIVVATDDACETRLVSYENTKCTMPVAQYLLSSVGT